MEITAYWMPCGMNPARFVQGSISPFHQWCPSISGFFAKQRHSHGKKVNTTSTVPYCTRSASKSLIATVWAWKDVLEVSGHTAPHRQGMTSTADSPQRLTPENELTSAPTTRAVARGMEKRDRLRDLGVQELFFPCLFHMQCRFESAWNSGMSCANLNCTEIRVLKRVGKWVAVDFKLHLVAEAVSANPGNEFSSVLSVSFPGTGKTSPASLISSRFQVQRAFSEQSKGWKIES